LERREYLPYHPNNKNSKYGITVTHKKESRVRHLVYEDIVHIVSYLVPTNSILFGMKWSNKCSKSNANSRKGENAQNGIEQQYETCLDDKPLSFPTFTCISLNKGLLVVHSVQNISNSLTNF